MAKQFANVSGRYGAPMGRHCVGHLDLSPRSVRLFRVDLDSGGYDDGGAYWGHGGTLWAAIDRDGDMQTVRAASRERAAFQLDIPGDALRVPLRFWADYGLALLDGRAPMPSGKDRAAATTVERQATRHDGDDRMFDRLHAVLAKFGGAL